MCWVLRKALGDVEVNTISINPIRTQYITYVTLLLDKGTLLFALSLESKSFNYGVPVFPNLDVCWKKSKGGGGSFPIKKNSLQIFLVSKRYILVVNFGKNVQKGGEGGDHFQSEALLDSDYLSLLRYLSFFSVLDNRLLADNLSHLPKVLICFRKGCISSW